jgi:hypothetical protein
LVTASQSLGAERSMQQRSFRPPTISDCLNNRGRRRSLAARVEAGLPMRCSRLRPAA